MAYLTDNESAANNFTVGKVDIEGSEPSWNPDGGTEEKPVGLVYVGCYVKGHVHVEEFRFTGNRDKNREYAVARALTLLREELLKN